MTSDAETVLVVVADADRRDRVAEALADAGFEVTTADSVASARDAVDDHYFEAVVTGYHLPDGDGLDVLGYARDVRPDTVCVLYTPTQPEDVDTTTHPSLVIEYVDASRPTAVDTLVDNVRTAIRHRAHTSYPLPKDEDDRLAILGEYLDLKEDAREGFDRLARIAELSLDTAVAFVGLLDRHVEHVVVCRGADWTTVEREESVCTYGILTEGLTVVEDLADDPRFSDHDYVTVRGLRFYAGAPLVTRDGYRIGMLCVMDDEPRTLDESERELLELLADEAMEQLDLRRLAERS